MKDGPPGHHPNLALSLPQTGENDPEGARSLSALQKEGSYGWGVSVPSSFLGKPRWHGDGIGMVLRTHS